MDRIYIVRDISAKLEELGVKSGRDIDSIKLNPALKSRIPGLKGWSYVNREDILYITVEDDDATEFEETVRTYLGRLDRTCLFYKGKAIEG